MSRTRPALALLALLALTVLLFRPVALDAVGLPFGSHHAAAALLEAENSAHCEILADCETVSIANTGLYEAATPLVLVLAGVVIVEALLRARVPRFWAPLLPDPPPLSALG